MIKGIYQILMTFIREMTTNGQVEIIDEADIKSLICIENAVSIAVIGGIGPNKSFSSDACATTAGPSQ
jgi:hypothetical protein